MQNPACEFLCLVFGDLWCCETQRALLLWGLSVPDSGRCEELSIVASEERELGEFGGDRGLCSRIRLWELPDQYVFEPTDAASSSRCLAISRVNGEITLLGEELLSLALKSARAY